MPGGDRTGPAGMGPMTGRGAGFCAGYAMPGYAHPVGGCGFAGMGRGRGRRHQFYATGVPGWARGGYGFGAAAAPAAAESEAAMLKQQADYLQDSLDRIHQRLDDIQKK